MKKENVLMIWKNRNQILEGILNSIFKREDIEQIADQRLQFCRTNNCGYHDPQGISEAAVIKGVESCASCGCKLDWKTRSLSSGCPKNLWEAVLTETEEAALKQKLGVGDDL